MEAYSIEFNAATRNKFIVLQLLQKFTRMREQYMTMKSIKDDSSITGIGWNSIQNNIECTAEQWERIKLVCQFVVRKYNFIVIQICV